MYAILKTTTLRRNGKILRIILLIIFGTWFTYKSYNTFLNDFFLDGIILLIIAFIGILILIWTVRKFIKEFKASRKLTSYFPIAIGILFIITNICLFVYQESKTNSPSLITGFNDGGFNGFSVDFKTNGNYMMANGSGLGESYFYGKYSIKDSIITIDKSNIDNCIKTNKLVIRTEQYYLPLGTNSKVGGANYITQVDDNGREIDKDFRFRVTTDNRDKNK
jgi:hypothetical protein